MKLVTTGRDGAGRSVFVEDDRPAALVASGFAGLVNTPLWADDEVPAVGADGSRPTTAGDFLPPPGGHRFFVLTIAPDQVETAPPTTAQVAEFESLFPGLLATYDGEPGMHATRTTDLGILLAGRLVLELDDGAERVLEAGDAFVQTGTRHRWRNPGPDAATFAVVMIGAR
ncbi:cupin domain-containing protein [Actinomycetospora flava]|uniref:Cupin domain-containing protein n=1 Tax=Actinomycetospora flava TaxID=3129232 RepID=A0ABU8M8H5_9PSEU